MYIYNRIDHFNKLIHCYSIEIRTIDHKLVPIQSSVVRRLTMVSHPTSLLIQVYFPASNNVRMSSVAPILVVVESVFVGACDCIINCDAKENVIFRI